MNQVPPHVETKPQDTRPLDTGKSKSCFPTTHSCTLKCISPNMRIRCSILLNNQLEVLNISSFRFKSHVHNLDTLTQGQYVQCMSVENGTGKSDNRRDGELVLGSAYAIRVVQINLTTGQYPIKHKIVHEFEDVLSVRLVEIPGLKKALLAQFKKQAHIYSLGGSEPRIIAKIPCQELLYVYPGLFLLSPEQSTSKDNHQVAFCSISLHQNTKLQLKIEDIMEFGWYVCMSYTTKGYITLAEKSGFSLLKYSLNDRSVRLKKLYEATTTSFYIRDIVISDDTEWIMLSADRSVTLLRRVKQADSQIQYSYSKCFSYYTANPVDMLRFKIVKTQIKDFEGKPQSFSYLTGLFREAGSHDVSVYKLTDFNKSPLKKPELVQFSADSKSQSYRSNRYQSKLSETPEDESTVNEEESSQEDANPSEKKNKFQMKLVAVKTSLMHFYVTFQKHKSYKLGWDFDRNIVPQYVRPIPPTFKQPSKPIQPYSLMHFKPQAADMQLLSMVVYGCSFTKDQEDLVQLFCMLLNEKCAAYSKCFVVRPNHIYLQSTLYYPEYKPEVIMDPQSPRYKASQKQQEFLKKHLSYLLTIRQVWERYLKGLITWESAFDTLDEDYIDEHVMNLFDKTCDQQNEWAACEYGKIRYDGETVSKKAKREGGINEFEMGLVLQMVTNEESLVV